MEINKAFAESAYKAFMYVLRSENIDIDVEKFEYYENTMNMILLNTERETDVSDIPDFLDMLVSWFNENTDYLRVECENCGRHLNKGEECNDCLPF